MSTRLGDIITVLTDYHSNGSYKVLKKNVELNDQEDYALMVRTTNFEQKNFTSLNKYISKNAYNFMHKSKVYPFDIIMNKIANAGSVYLMPDLKRPVSLAMNLFLIRVDENKADPVYVYNHLKLYEPYIKQFANGTAAKTITKDTVKNLVFEFPQIDIQQKIASILSAYDELIENNNKRIQLLEEMVEELYKEWFVRMRFPGYQNTPFYDKEGKEVPHGTKEALPKEWSKSQLKNHIEYYRGKSYSSTELRDKEGLAMLNLKNINRQGGFRLDGLKYFEGKYNLKNEAHPGDIIMAITDMTQQREIVGRVARVPDMGIEKFIISMDLIRIEPIQLPKLYLYCFLRYSGIGLQLKEFANGANVLHLTPSLIEFQKAIIPDKKICEDFERLIKPMLDEIDILNKKNQLLQETRDLLLPRLISGKLSVENIKLEEHQTTTV